MRRSPGAALQGMAASVLLQTLVLSSLLALTAGLPPGFKQCNKKDYKQCCSNKKCCISWKKPAKVKTFNIQSGDTCTWVWTDAIAHCVTIKRPNADNIKGSVQITGKGYTWSAKFKKPGTYKISCCVHISFMRAIIQVKKKKSLSESVDSNCYGKCYGASSSGDSCPYPHLRTPQSCHACCTIGRPPHAPGVEQCRQQCQTP